MLTYTKARYAFLVLTLQQDTLSYTAAQYACVWYAILHFSHILFSPLPLNMLQYAWAWYSHLYSGKTCFPTLLQGTVSYASARYTFFCYLLGLGLIRSFTTTRYAFLRFSQWHFSIIPLPLYTLGSDTLFFTLARYAFLCFRQIRFPPLLLNILGSNTLSFTKARNTFLSFGWVSYA